MTYSLPYRILAVDPATTKSGWAVLDVVSLNPLKIIIVATGQLDGQKLLRKRKEMSEIFSPQFCILDALIETYKEIVEIYKPHRMVSEGAFAHLHVSAALALTLAINILRMVSKMLLNKDIVIVPPTITKMAFTGKGGADKDLMRWAYRTHDYLEGKVPEDDISEHEIDAVAHGVGHIRRDLIGDVVQLSGKEKRAAKRERAEKALAKKLAKEKG